MKRILAALALLCAMGAGSVAAQDQRADFRSIIEQQTNLPADEVNQITEMAMEIDKNVYGYAVEEIREAITRGGMNLGASTIDRMTQDLQMLTKASRDADFRADFSEAMLKSNQGRASFRTAMNRATGGMFSDAVAGGLVGVGAFTGAKAFQRWRAAPGEGVRERFGAAFGREDVVREDFPEGAMGRAAYMRSRFGRPVRYGVGAAAGVAGAALPFLTRTERGRRFLSRMGRYARMGYGRFREGLGWMGAKMRRLRDYAIANPQAAALGFVALSALIGAGITQYPTGKRWASEKWAARGVRSVTDDLKKLLGTGDDSLSKLVEAASFAKVGKELNEAILKDLTDEEKSLLLEDASKAIEARADGGVGYLWSAMGPYQRDLDVSKAVAAAAKIAKHRAEHEKKDKAAVDAREKAAELVASIANAIDDYASKKGGAFDATGKKSIDEAIKKAFELKDQAGETVKDKVAAHRARQRTFNQGVDAARKAHMRVAAAA